MVFDIFQTETHCNELRQGDHVEGIFDEFDIAFHEFKRFYRTRLNQTDAE